MFCILGLRYFRLLFENHAQNITRLDFVLYSYHFSMVLLIRSAEFSNGTSSIDSTNAVGPDKTNNGMCA